MAAVFRKAERHNLMARVALCGPTGSGKTFTALGVAITLADGGKVAVIDTERSSADRYADKFSFDTCPLEHFSPESYMEAIEAASSGGYAALIIDSLSHAWDGAEGLLERVDAIAKRSRSGNTFNAWGEATPLHRRLIDAILAFPGHVIVTMRSKMEYVLETNDKGKQVPRKVGMAPVQRQGVEYEFDIVGDIDQEHNLIISKSRCFALADQVVNRPGKKFAQEILTWARGGKATADTKPPAPVAKPADPTPATPTPAPSSVAPAQPAPSTPAVPPTTPSAQPTPASNSGAAIAAQLANIRALATENGMKSAEERKALIEGIISHPLTDMSALTADEREKLITRLTNMLKEEK